MIVNHYIKIMHYLSMKKTLIIIKLTKLFLKEVALRYEISNDNNNNNNNNKFIHSCDID